MPGMLEGRAIVVTGSGRGLGRDYAIAIAGEGARVVINDVDLEPAEAVAAEIVAQGGIAIAHGSSVADWDGAGGLIAACVDEFGTIDGLLNNAGVTHTGPVVEETEAEIRRLFEVNALGTIFTGTHALKVMASNRSGSVVNVTSRVELGSPNVAAYASTKGAISSLTYCWALEMAEYGIRVNALAPLAQTRMMTGWTPPGLTELADPSEIAPLAVYLMSDRVRMSGQVYRLDGTTLNLMTHAEFPDSTGVTRTSWTAEQIADEFDTNTGFQPGTIGTDYRVNPLKR